MNDTQTYSQQDFVEIRLKDLILSVLLHWKKILCIALVMAVLASLYTGIKEMLALSDQQAAEAKREEYNKLLEDYERTSTQLQKKIEDTETELVRQENYRETALMVLIDPYDVHTEKFSYFVDTNYEIAPSQYYQNPDHTSTIARAYVLEIQGIDFDSVLSDAGKTKYTTYNPVSGNELKLVNASAKDSGILEITIYGDNDEQLDIIKSSVVETLSAKQEEFSRLIGNHTLELISSGRKVSVNKDFVALKEAFNKNFETLSADLEAARKSLSELVAPENTAPSRINLAKRTIKHFVIGGVLGVFLGTFAVAVYLIGTNKLMNPEEITHRYNVPVLGVMNSDTMPRIRKLVAKGLGAATDASPDEKAEYIASSFKLHTKDNPCSKLLLLGTAGEEAMESIKEKIGALLDGIEIVTAGNTNKSSKALRELAGDAAIVCVEKWQKSSLGDIENEMRTIKAAGKAPVGVVVVD